MFYSNYDNYMQDLFYYNQFPNNRSTYNPYANNFAQAPNTPLENLYPSIYKIINPVILRVLAGNNTQYLTEDNLNNLVETVYNIIEGQIDVEDENNDNTSNTVQNTRVSTDRNVSCSYNNESNSKKTNNLLLKDLIKIVILKEFSSRRNPFNGGQYFMQNPYMFNQPNFQPFFV